MVMGSAHRTVRVAVRARSLDECDVARPAAIRLGSDAGATAATGREASYRERTLTGQEHR
jgi:hypothetical protein